MGQIARQFMNQAKSLKVQTLRQAKKENILSSDINYLRTNDQVPFGIQYFPLAQGVVMDRGGN